MWEKIQKQLNTYYKSTWGKLLLSLGCLFILFLITAPQNLFNDPFATVVTDREGNLLSAQIASDGQWRFPQGDSIPEKFKQCILLFEDEYFYFHPGINPISMVHAFIQNWKAGRVVRGGSTITNQVMRLSHQGKARSVKQKLIESIEALQLECLLSKEEILGLYTAHAPFGGNVVGLESASWRYYGRSPHQLSWSESATLAVLPNAPSLIYPGKSHLLLKKKRNFLLQKLYQKGCIDSVTCSLAQMEELPQKPQALPQYTPHLLTRFVKNGRKGERIQSTIDLSLQRKANRIIDKHHNMLSQNGIQNACAIIVEVESGNVVAYIGNCKTNAKDSGTYVDILQAPRSTGSIIKPILYALMQEEGLQLPKSLIKDIPTYISGYVPTNFDKSYSGACPADEALARSLNIPAVRMLQEYGVERFYEKLKKLGLTTLTQPANHYGLSLILGGAETTGWELVKMYSNLARNLTFFTHNSSEYNVDNDRSPRVEMEHSIKNKTKTTNQSTISASATWLAFEALTKLKRPAEEGEWIQFSSSKRIAWKTGTSYGHRDAWSVGITPNYVVLTWAGNADGEGRPGLTGSRSASPILFDLFKQLPKTGWFETPYDDLIETKVCTKSGYKYGPHCESADTILTTLKGSRTKVCPFHQMVHLDKEEHFRVTSRCYPVAKMKTKRWFVLPPTLAYYYKSKNPFYKNLPPMDPNCMGEEKQMAIIYPPEKAKIFIPKGFGSKKQKVIFEATHNLSNKTLHWHLDKQFLTSTEYEHKVEVECAVGNHIMTLVDDSGNLIERKFEVVE